MTDGLPTTMGWETLVLARAGGVATLTLNRPEARNALDLVMRRELGEALDALAGDGATRVVVLTGAGGHFCAGGDVKTMRAHRHTAAEGRARVELLHRTVLKLADFPRPTIAAVAGAAVGAGCNLALACDLVIAAEGARFGQVFSAIGLVPDGGGTWLLPRAVGLARAKELVFTAELLDAAQAARIGLVNRVVPADALADEAAALAARIAAGPPAALELAKRLLNRAATSDLPRALEAEALAQGLSLASEDHQEGLAAFFERRPPRFSGR